MEEVVCVGDFVLMEMRDRCYFRRARITSINKFSGRFACIILDHSGSPLAILVEQGLEQIVMKICV